jgi:hypothetical protein
MTPLTEATRARIHALFPADKYAQVESLLENQCADNLPFYSNATPEKLERIRYATLKLSEGQLDKLQRAIVLAQSDWRDLLMAVGFGHIQAHESWLPTPIAREPYS